MPMINHCPCCARLVSRPDSDAKNVYECPGCGRWWQITALTTLEAIHAALVPAALTQGAGERVGVEALRAAADDLREWAGLEFPFNFRGGKSLWCSDHGVYHPDSLCAVLRAYDAARALTPPAGPRGE